MSRSSARADSRAERASACIKELKLKFEKYVHSVVMTLASDGDAASGRVGDLMVDRRFLDFLHGTLGIASEIGELTEALRKARYAIDLDSVSYIDEDIRLEVLGELGDIMWFTGLTSRALGVVGEIGGGVDSRSYDGMVYGGVEPTEEMIIYSADLLSRAKAKMFYDRDIRVAASIVLLRRIVAGTRIIAGNFGWTLEDVIEANIQKLEKRYPNMEFSKYRANERDTDAEFEAMKV